MAYLHRDQQMAIRSVDSVLVVGWLGQPNLSSAVALERATRAHAPLYPAGIAHLNVVAKSSNAASFEDAARKKIVAMLHDRALPMVASVTVYGGGGFVAATIRGVLASLTMLARTPVKIRFVGTIEEAEPFLLESLRRANAVVPAPGLLAASMSELIVDAKAAGFEF